MSVPPLTELLPAVALGLALAACAGLRAWLPLLLSGILCRMGLLHLGPSFQFLSTNKALIVFAIATVVEIAGDKVPAVDHTLDAVSSVLRPAAGALLAASAIGVVTDPLTATTLGIAVGAPIALVPHAAKVGVRAASTALTGGLANPILSFLEDLASIVMYAVAVLVPLAVVLAVLGAAFVVLRRLARGRPSVPTQAAPTGAH